jgi:pimeloyl-ACP methyl ester carboxylesterase
MAQLHANDLTFHVQRVGGGDETVVMLHGLLIDNLSSHYYAVAPAVADHMDVVLYDLRGHGHTERPADGYKLDDAVSDLFAVLDTLGVTGPVHLLGNSYGGTIALDAAIKRPERVRSLVLIDAHIAVARWCEDIGEELALARAGLLQKDPSTWSGVGGGRKAAKLLRGAAALITQTTLVEDLASTPPLPDELLRAITCPTIGIYGEYSDVIDRAHDLERLLPKFELDILMGCSHSVMLEATLAVRDAVADFYRRLADGRIEPGAHREIDLDEPYDAGEMHRALVDVYRNELRRHKHLIEDAPPTEPASAAG